MVATGKRILKKIGFAVALGAIVGALLLLSSPGTSQAISFDLTAGGDFGSGGNLGLTTIPSATKDGVTLELTALTGLTDNDPMPVFFDGTGGPGTVFIDPLGAGVQSATGMHSTGISGVGVPKGNETLILTFDSSLDTSLAVLTLNNYSIGSDDVVIYLDPGNTSKPHWLSVDHIEPNLTCVLMVCTLNFSDLPLLSGDPNLPDTPATYSTLAVRSINGHFFVSGITVVPEPSTLLLLGSGLAGLGLWRWKRRNGVD